MIEESCGQTYCPFGNALVEMRDLRFGLNFSRIGAEDSQIKQAFSNNADFVSGSCAGHFHADQKKDFMFYIINESNKFGGAILHSNSIGCDGENNYFGGGNIIAQNGNIIGTGPYHSMNEIEVTNSVLNLQKVRLMRQKLIGSQRESLNTHSLPIIKVDAYLCCQSIKYSIPYTPVIDSASQQYAEVASSFLWDYLRKTGASGYFVGVSGGVETSANAICVYYMCMKVFKEVHQGNAFVLKTLRKIVKDDKFTPASSAEVVKKLCYTGYLGLTENDVYINFIFKTIN